MAKTIRGSIKYKMKHEICEQFRSGYGSSRHEYKKSSKKFANYEKIYSENSRDTNVSGVEMFGRWLKDNYPSVKNISDLNVSLVAEYIRDRSELGLSAWTISRDITSINHVLVGQKVIDNPVTKKFLAREYDLDLNKRCIENIVNNRSENELLSKQIFYDDEKYCHQVDVAESFGLRRSEIISDEKGLTVDSFYFDKSSQNLYVVTIGKGGRYRYVECLESRRDEMIERYDDYIHEISNVDELPDFEETKKIIRESEHLFSSKMTNNLTLHRCRSEYAKELFYQKLENSVSSDENNCVVINDIFEAPKEIMEEVSKNLGHNRIDVLRHYLR